MDLRKVTVELIGTFFFVLTIGQVVVDATQANSVIAPLAIGSALMVMVYAGGHISGGHYNPAVTLAVWIRGRCPGRDVVPYWIAQAIGAGLAGAVVIYLKGHPADVANDPNVARSLVAETLYTFALAYVVLNCATSKVTAGNSFYGLAIGFTVLIGAFAVGSISDGAFNPAVALGLGVMGVARPGHVAILVAADLVGGLLAGLAFRYLNPDDLEPLAAVTEHPRSLQAKAERRAKRRNR